MAGITYDIETFPNVFTFTFCPRKQPDQMHTFEISFRRDDRQLLLQWFDYWYQTKTEMTGYNNLGFDYVICHALFMTPDATVTELYDAAQRIITSQDRFGQMIWQDQRFAPQIDLYKIHHFDNKAKTQSLKGLEFNMRSANVMDSPVGFGRDLTASEIDTYLIPYNQHDVSETDRFADISEPNIDFRRQLLASGTVIGDVLNFNDTKIGKKLIEQKLGDDLCFQRNPITGRREPRQTLRPVINLGDVVFPYIRFNRPEFQRILEWFKHQTITETKGVFTDLNAVINGMTFSFGTGGIHGSITSTAVHSDAEHVIEDVDVIALYPSIAIENRLYPAHFGEVFVNVYRTVRDERKQYPKGTVMNGALKLAANGAYGDSNNPWSALYDPQFTMAITINGQLMLCMLAEWLMDVPTVQIIQINTDGVTYKVHRSRVQQARDLCAGWERFTRLTLEYERYSRMFIRDVNNYLAETEKGKLKAKGAYWFPVKFPDDISNASPSAWYKDLGGLAIPRAAQMAMLHGLDPAIFMQTHTNPFDFCMRAKATKGTQLFIGDKPTQKLTRYYIANTGGPLHIHRPATGPVGTWKRRNGITDAEYYAVAREIPAGQWDERIHTKNRSIHAERDMSFAAGWQVAECNDMAQFDWSNLNRDWYVQEARKLVIT